MFNKVVLIGYLGRDPDLRYLPSGVAIATLRLCINTRYKQGDDFKDEVLFIDTIVFGKQAESCAQHLEKGDLVLVEGRLRERKWESDGIQKSKIEVVTNTVRFLPKKDNTTKYDSQPDISDETFTPEPF